MRGSKWSQKNADRVKPALQGCDEDILTNPKGASSDYELACSSFVAELQSTLTVPALHRGPILFPPLRGPPPEPVWLMPFTPSNATKFEANRLTSFDADGDDVFAVVGDPGLQEAEFALIRPIARRDHRYTPVIQGTSRKEASVRSVELCEPYEGSYASLDGDHALGLALPLFRRDVFERAVALLQLAQQQLPLGPLCTYGRDRLAGELVRKYGLDANWMPFPDDRGQANTRELDNAIDDLRRSGSGAFEAASICLRQEPAHRDVDYDTLKSKVSSTLQGYNRRANQRKGLPRPNLSPQDWGEARQWTATSNVASVLRALHRHVLSHVAEALIEQKLLNPTAATAGNRRSARRAWLSSSQRDLSLADVTRALSRAVVYDFSGRLYGSHERVASALNHAYEELVIAGEQMVSYRLARRRRGKETASCGTVIS